MSEYGQIPATRASVYPKSVNGVTEIILHAMVIHTIRNTRRPNIRIEQHIMFCFRLAREGPQIGYIIFYGPPTATRRHCMTCICSYFFIIGCSFQMIGATNNKFARFGIVLGTVKLMHVR